MTDDKMIAFLTFWRGSEAAKDWAEAETKRKLDEEKVATVPVFDAGQDYE